MTTTPGTSARTFGEGVWHDLNITTEFDGEAVLIDAGPRGLNRNDYPLGLPGVGLQLTPEQAVDLAFALLRQANGQTASADLLDAIEYAAEDLSYRADQGKDYEPEDMAGIRAKLTRWDKLSESLSPAARS